MIGATASHYRILQELGRGGMGEVYLAEDTRLRRPVALKMLRKCGPDDAEIAGVQCSFIAMEYVAGETLAALAARRSRTSIARFECGAASRSRARGSSRSSTRCEASADSGISSANDGTAPQGARREARFLL